MDQLPVKILRQLIACNPTSGKLFWRPRALRFFKTERACKIWNTRFAGKQCGSPGPDGYLRISILGNKYLLHRVLWAIVKGRWPTEEIDHLKGKRSDNRIIKLREANSGENGKNQKLPISNTSGVHGVHWHKASKKWKAEITVNGKKLYLGIFTSLTTAVRVRKKALKTHNFHKNHGSPRAFSRFKVSSPS